jgi:hypothetical protein
MKLTTEQILTHPKAFGLVTATPLQRAFCRISDGLPLSDLADDPRVVEAVGGADAVAALPIGRPPTELHVLAAIRTFKSMLGAAKILQWSQSVDVSKLSRGDIVRVGVIGLKLESTRAVMSHAVENLLAKPLLRPLLIGEPSLNGFTLRHPSGRPIEVTPMPLDRAGGSTQTTWLAGVVIDEEPRMIGASDGVKNFDVARQGVSGRVLDGGGTLGIGAPHAPFGPIFDMFVERFGKPTPGLVMLRGKGPDLNPSWWTPERCEDLRVRNHAAYRTDVLCEFGDADSALIAASDLDVVTRTSPDVLPFRPDVEHIAAIDPSGKTNAFALVIGSRELRDDAVLVRLAKIRQWVPTRGRSLDLDLVFKEIRKEVGPYGITKLHSDQFSVDSNDALASYHGMRIEQTAITGANKFELYSELAAAIVAKRFEVCADPVLRADLLGIRRQLTQSGVTIRLPITSDGRHGDYAAACALLVHAANGKRNPMIDALRYAVRTNAAQHQAEELQRAIKFGLF